MSNPPYLNKYSINHYFFVLISVFGGVYYFFYFLISFNLFNFSIFQDFNIGSVFYLSNQIIKSFKFFVAMY